ncbi:MAG TPA: trifunctional transcriptional regulator/proline dehydrogenase/L-glutamate gamma-semialdehyde dehydrogenase [Xanthobacteraceae bacterium]|nr:MAG: trifunctional transcriptional regulator/proline dehydrogenase/L-glutamate gamma-semialdehyde dehydrogenase [Rhizobiales bacterium 39-66-18]HQS10313.1 trifunctional transcriptional regulator/proline dehydrogenase/L-glutamate gamma-semialdehyde dehydrogenase [Xanthobacteraceae bacterium]
MGTTIGVKVDEALRARLKAAAARQGRTPHFLVKQALVAMLDTLDETEASLSAGATPLPEALAGARESEPFLAFAQAVRPESVLRARITAAYRAPEEECLPRLISDATLPSAQTKAVAERAKHLIRALRAKAGKGAVEALIHEYDLSSQEGIALLCLAEALLRIPDRPTRDALIRDKIGQGDWLAHLGHSRSVFVNAATWGLLVTGRLTGTSSEAGLAAALSRLVARGGEPLIRAAVDMTMRMMGEQFVTGETISEALANSRAMEAKGFRHSYDMLGEAAMTAEDAARYLAAYVQAIHAIGKAAARRGIHDGPGISIKLSALHPRYARAQRERVMREMLPRVLELARLARSYDIGLNIDAEEADRLDLSLDVLEALCLDPNLAGWNGIGFVVQAYQKRAMAVLDFIIDLGRRTARRIMVRLVKGAYWDAEIKRAQMEGLEGFPVFTRKVHTDVSYLACARRLLAAPDAVFPQFATHNAQTLSAIMALAGENYYAGQYEFQCLHGMGEPLYEEVVGPEKLNRPCRIYAPVGPHETLLAYLVRRLLENGANSSFVHRIADDSFPVEALAADPVAEARAIAPLGAPNPHIAAPRDLFGDRPNAAGLDFSNEQRLASLAAALLASQQASPCAAPMLANEDSGRSERAPRAVRNPADLRDTVGHVVDADPALAALALHQAATLGPVWSATPAAERARCLRAAADLLEARMPSLLGLIVREAGKSLPNAVGEVREAVDFLRYYAGAADAFEADSHRPLGPVVCISPWNFPLAIFTGQIAAALAAGNPVLAKPAEETPLIAAAAVKILREAGVPPAALQLLPGDGTLGAALVADPRTCGVLFTGSTEVARLIRTQLAARLGPDGRPVPLVAETGGQNALVVDSSALPEQVVADALVSAFDSAGQRCSALRLLCLQEETAERVLAMLRGALAEWCVGDPALLSTDMGPLITAEARAGIAAYVEAMRARGFKVTQALLPEACRHGTFLPPTMIEIDQVDDLTREVFGPVLHVLRYRRDERDTLIDAINATGYGLTFGRHTRIDETIAQVAARISAGNLYINRNLIGAVVGVQPFGGHGLSGTGPKAGGPLYLRRLLAQCPPLEPLAPAPVDAAARAWIAHLAAQGHNAHAARCAALADQGLAGAEREMAGPVGERNLYSWHPRGTVLLVPATPLGLSVQMATALAAGNRVLVDAPALKASLANLPAEVKARVTLTENRATALFDAALFEGESDRLLALEREMAQRDGPIVAVHGLSPGALAAGAAYPVEWLLRERTISINTAAAGGNATLLALG